MLDDNERIKALDNAFIFLISLSTSIFAIGNFYLTDRLLLNLIPIIVVWTVFPFYIGYLRGVISENDLVERVRGWIYLIVGTLTYIAILTDKIKFFGDNPVSIYLILIFGGIYLAKKTVEWILTTFNHQLKIYERNRIVNTVGASCLLAYPTFSFAQLPESFASDLSTLAVSLDFQIIIWTLAGTVIFERLARASFSSDFSIEIDLDYDSILYSLNKLGSYFVYPLMSFLSVIDPTNSKTKRFAILFFSGMSSSLIGYLLLGGPPKSIGIVSPDSFLYIIGNGFLIASVCIIFVALVYLLKMPLPVDNIRNRLENQLNGDEN